jgi:2-polyprenyl-3-methyl-5-hydroxy-6-metoxy-1,4-benzoquinol methylase
MRALRAKPVHATDSFDKTSFRRAKDVLGLDDIHYHPNTQIKDFHEIFSPGQFDLILCAGVPYHMLNPVSAFVTSRKLIKDGGLLILETSYFKVQRRR